MLTEENCTNDLVCSKKQNKFNKPYMSSLTSSEIAQNPQKKATDLMSKDFQIIYILGAGHSGSTLLNLLLNGHSQILGLSEIQQIRRYMGHNSKDDRLQTDFWQDVKQRYEIATGEPFTSINVHWKEAPIWNIKDTKRRENLIAPTLFSELADWKIIRTCEAKDFADWIRHNEYIFACLAEKSGAKILIDSSKHWQRLYLLHKSGRFKIKVIHLVRDGRAVVNSYIHKFGNFNVGLRRWMSRGAIVPFYLRREFEQSDWLQLRYEELATKPEITLTNLCDFLKLEYESQMLNYRKHLNVGMRGNRKVNKRQDDKIVLDEKWKQELSRLNLIRFALLGGWLNTYYGY